MNINVPNFITLGRVIAVPVVFRLLLNVQVKAAIPIFVAAGISDAVDGYLAKRFDLRTELGAYLDPLADKLLIVSIYIALGVRGEIPSWLVIAVVSRDFLILAGVMLAWLMNHPMTIKPLAVSKANTFAQLVLASTVLADNAFALELVNARTVLVWIAGILTMMSLAAYLRDWIAHMTSDAQAAARPGDGPGDHGGL